MLTTIGSIGSEMIDLIARYYLLKKAAFEIVSPDILPKQN